MPCITKQNKCFVDQVKDFFLQVSTVLGVWIYSGGCCSVPSQTVNAAFIQWAQRWDRCGIWYHKKIALEHREKCFLLLSTPASLVMMRLIAESLLNSVSLKLEFSKAKVKLLLLLKTSWRRTNKTFCTVIPSQINLEDCQGWC